MATKHCAICEADFIWSDCVEGGRVDLAQKILQEVSNVKTVWATSGRADSMAAADIIVAALRDLFNREGVGVD